MSNLKVKDSNTGYQSKGSKKQYYLNSVTYTAKGHAVVQLVEALRYKPESRGFVGIFH